MSQEFEKCTILKDADVSYSASSVQQPASAEVSQVRPWGWIADGRLFHLRAAAIEAADKTPVIDVYTSGQLARIQQVNAALQARLTVADQRVDDLTSERDKLKAQLTDSDHCYRQAHDTGVAVMRERDGLLAKIETLRSLLSQASGMVNGASSDWHDAVAKELNRESF